MTRRFSSSAFAGYVEVAWQRRMLSEPRTSTAWRICFGVDMPVERMTVRPVARRARSSSSSVREAEATLWAGTSNFSRKATASVSHGEANQSMPRLAQCSAMAVYSASPNSTRWR